MCPYINALDRLKLQDGLTMPTTPGELNYLFTKTIEKYVLMNGARYHVFNDVIGALEGAKLEFYRRIVSPYEDKKMEENGDVY